MLLQTLSFPFSTLDWIVWEAWIYQHRVNRYHRPVSHGITLQEETTNKKNYISPLSDVTVTTSILFWLIGFHLWSRAASSKVKRRNPLERWHCVACTFTPPHVELTRERKNVFFWTLKQITTLKNNQYKRWMTPFRCFARGRQRPIIKRFSSKWSTESVNEYKEQATTGELEVNR